MSLPKVRVIWSVVRRHKAVALVAVFASIVLLAMAWSASASTRGRLVAHFDIAQGHYEVQGHGLPVPWRAEYAELLQRRYGVNFRTVALCIVSRSFVAYVDSYNDVSMRAVNRKFGRDVFKECAEESRKNWERTHPMQSRRERSNGLVRSAAGNPIGCRWRHIKDPVRTEDNFIIDEIRR